MSKAKRNIEVVIRDEQGKPVTCGKFETEIDGYVLSVPVPDAPVQVRSIEIEFFKKGVAK